MSNVRTTRILAAGKSMKRETPMERLQRKMASKKKTAGRTRSTATAAPSTVVFGSPPHLSPPTSLGSASHLAPPTAFGSPPQLTPPSARGSPQQLVPPTALGLEPHLASSGIIVGSAPHLASSGIVVGSASRLAPSLMPVIAVKNSGASGTSTASGAPVECSAHPAAATTASATTAAAAATTYAATSDDNAAEEEGRRNAPTTASSGDIPPSSSAKNPKATTPLPSPSREDSTPKTGQSPPPGTTQPATTAQETLREVEQGPVKNVLASLLSSTVMLKDGERALAASFPCVSALRQLKYCGPVGATEAFALGRVLVARWVCVFVFT